MTAGRVHIMPFGAALLPEGKLVALRRQYLAPQLPYIVPGGRYQINDGLLPWGTP